MTHEVVLQGYNVKPGSLQLGTFDSYGIEKIHVTADDSWDGLAIVVTFNPPEGDAVEVRVPEDGTVDVPPEATTYEGKGTIVFCGVDSGVQRITKTMGYVVITHANVGTDTAFTPSEDLAAQVLNAALSAERSSTEANTAAQGAQKAAENAASAAQASAESASKAAAEAAAAKPYTESAKASAEAARDSENQAQQSSTEATAAKNAAQNAQAGAESSAAAAAKSAKEAAASAVNLDNAVNTATQKAAAASASAAAAKASENAAANSEAATKTYAESARTAKNSAAASAETANAAKDSASASARDAAASKIAAAASEKNAAKSANSAADSAAAAKKSAEDADNTANSINNSMTQIAANKEAVSQLKEDTAVLQKRQNVLVGSETGNPVSCDDAYSAPLCGLTVYGKSTQDGTPTPDAPVPIVSAGDGGMIAVTLSDGHGKTQTLTLPTPTGLPGIPVTSGGNYTDGNGQQWVCDEVDLERGVKVQRVTTMVFSDSLGFAAESTTNGIRFSRATRELKKTDTTTPDSGAFCSALALGRPGSSWLTPNVFSINVMLYVRFENINSLGELQQYLQQTPMSLTAILAAPIETPLTPAEIAAYKALTAYAPDTVVQASDGAGVKLEYQRDVNIAIKKLEDAIASMTTT